MGWLGSSLADNRFAPAASGAVRAFDVRTGREVGRLDPAGCPDDRMTAMSGARSAPTPKEIWSVCRSAARRRTLSEAAERQHKDTDYLGAHPALVDVETFDAVQAMLARSVKKIRVKRRPQTASSLRKGILFDAASGKVQESPGVLAFRRSLRTVGVAKTWKSHQYFQRVRRPRRTEGVAGGAVSPTLTCLH